MMNMVTVDIVASDYWNDEKGGAERQQIESKNAAEKEEEEPEGDGVDDGDGDGDDDDEQRTDGGQ